MTGPRAQRSVSQVPASERWDTSGRMPRSSMARRKSRPRALRPCSGRSQLLPESSFAKFQVRFSARTPQSAPMSSFRTSQSSISAPSIERKAAALPVLQASSASRAVRQCRIRSGYRASMVK